MTWKGQIKKQDAKLALESLLREINRDMQALEPIPEKQFKANIMRVKTSSYKEQVERILEMM